MELPSAPPESQVLIDFDPNVIDDAKASSSSVLPVTPGTANAEKLAVTILDVENIRSSIFKNERFAAILWCAFIFLYWTPSVWFPILSQQKFSASPGIFIWCFGFIGLLSSSYLLKDGKNPSGSTKEEPNKVNGIGRYTAMVLVCSILTDFTLRIYDIDNRIFPEPVQYDLILISGHTISIFWCSFFYYGRFKHINPEIANVVFVSEWIDILITIISFCLLCWYYDNGCDGHWLCYLYFIIIPIKFILWILPMMMIKGWGTYQNGTRVSIQVFVTNILTNLPIIFVIEWNQLYAVYVVVYIDLLIKTFIIIRGTAYYMIFNVWLNRGLRQELRKRGLRGKSTPKSRVQKKMEKQERDKKNNRQPVSESEIVALKQPGQVEENNPDIVSVDDDDFVRVNVSVK